MNEQLLERIDRYLEGAMSAEERAAFESEAAGNEELSTLLAIYSGIETDMRENAAYGNQEAALRQTLNRLNTAYFTDLPHQGTEQAVEPTDLPESEKQEPGESIPGDEASAAPRGRVRSMNVRRLLLVAAACIGIVFVGIKLWKETNKNGSDPQIVKKDSPAVAPVVPGVPPDTQALVQQRPPLHNQPEGPSPVLQNPNGGTDTAQRRPPSQRMEDMVHTKPTLSPSADNNALFAANFVRDIVLPAPEDRPDEVLDIAFDAYKEGDDKTAEMAFKEKDQVSRGGDRGGTRSEAEEKRLTTFYRNYYLAQIYLNDNSTTRAISELESALRQRPEEQFKVKTQWYLALAYLKNKEWQQAIDLLEKVSRQTKNEELRKQAAALLAEIKKD